MRKLDRSGYFTFHKGERRAIYVLIGLLMGIIITSTFFTCLNNAESPSDAGEYLSADSLFFDSLRADAPPDRQNTKSYYAVGDVPRAETFFFDPNTADSTDLLRLGLAPWMVRNIYKYRAKGGQYHSAEDFSKTYGLTKGDWERLRPYIRIAEKYKYLAETDAVADTVSLPRRQKLAEGEQIELNAADTAALQMVPGIGPSRARRIISYRDRLGGFVALEQLSEIEDLPDSVARFFSLVPAVTKKLYVNRMSVNELRRHPYLNFYQSRVITEHRRKFGPLRDLKSLSLYEEFTADDLARLAPYVSFEE